MRILFLSRWFPFPPVNGSKIRVFNLLRSLADRHEVTLLSFAEAGEDARSAELLGLCRSVQTVAWKPYNPSSLKARLGLLSSKPRSVLDTYSQVMGARIEACLAAEAFDLILASQIDMAAYAPHFRGVPAVLEELEVGMLHDAYAAADTIWKRARAGLTWAKYRRYVRRTLERFDACTVVSEREKQVVSRIVPESIRIEVVPNGVHLAEYRDVSAVPEPNTMIYAGAMTYEPNYEAMVWFVGEVLPRIQAELPEARLTITGERAERALPAGRGVTLAGFVEDVRPVIAASWLSLAPLLAGGGTRVKILESMALRTPVVATSKGAEGLNAENGIHLLVADDAPAFSRAVLSLLRDPELREGLAREGYNLVRREYDWKALTPRFLEIVDQAAQGRATPDQALPTARPAL